MKKKRIGFVLAAVLLIAGFGTLILYGLNTDDREMRAQEETGSRAETATGTEYVTDAATVTDTATATGDTHLAYEVVALSADGVDGSCVILHGENSRYIVATASHVASYKPEKVWFAGKEAVLCGYWKSKDYDLAFLELELENSEDISDLKAASINLEAYEETEPQDEIVLYGVVAGEKVSQKGLLLDNWIYIEDFGYHMLWAQAENVKGGMSGGGVFDGKGRLLGILLGSDGASEIVALPINIIAGEWERSDLAGAIDIFSN